MGDEWFSQMAKNLSPMCINNIEKNLMKISGGNQMQIIKKEYSNEKDLFPSNINHNHPNLGKMYQIQDLENETPNDESNDSQNDEDQDEWIDQGDYYLHLGKQGGLYWNEYRKKRVTMSVLGAAIGASSFSTPEDEADFISGIREKKFSDNSKRIMALGNEREPFARKWYSRKFGVKVEEIGIAIPKGNFYIGASADGEVFESDGTSEGIIEIKCPERMYSPLKNYISIHSKNKVNDRNNIYDTNHLNQINEIYLTNTVNDYMHIWKTHIIQMHGCMAVLNKKWCDYVVYCLDENSVFVQRIFFDQNFWLNDVYPKTINFIDHKLLPRLKGETPLIPNSITSE